MARYGFLAVSICGATISPYLLNFYSSGAIEDRWTVRDLSLNRANAVLGFTLGIAVLSAVLFGLLPALQATRADLAPTLKDEAGNMLAKSPILFPSRSVLRTVQFEAYIGAAEQYYDRAYTECKAS